MNNRVIIKYFRLLLFILMISIYLPIFSINVRYNIGNYKYWGILWLISIILFSTQTIFDKSVMYVIVFALIFSVYLANTLWVNIDEWNKVASNEYIFQILLSITFFAYFKISRDFNGLAMIIRWTLIFIVITAILSIYSSIIDPMYARYLTAGLYKQNEYFTITKIGGGGYAFAEALVLLFPMIIYFLRNNSKYPFSKLLTILFGILCFLCLVKLQFFATILISTIAIILALIGSKKIWKSVTYAGIILILTVLIPQDIIVDQISSASRFFSPKSENYYKINEFAKFIKNSGNDANAASERLDRYPLLWKGFNANPFTGFYNSKSKLDILPGAHLFWMNRLTVYGIFGFIPFIFIFYYFYKKTIKRFNEEYSYYFSLSILSGIGLGLMKNLAGMDFWCMFFFIIPSLYYMPQLKKRIVPVELKK